MEPKRLPEQEWRQSLWAEQEQKLMIDPGRTEQVRWQQQQKKLLMQLRLQLVSAAELQKQTWAGLPLQQCWAVGRQRPMYSQLQLLER